MILVSLRCEKQAKAWPQDTRGVRMAVWLAGGARRLQVPAGYNSAAQGGTAQSAAFTSKLGLAFRFEHSSPRA